MAGLPEGTIHVIRTSYQAAQWMSMQEVLPWSSGLPACVLTRFITFIAGRNDGHPAIVCNRITGSPVIT